MSDPPALPGRTKTRRADPLQPDKPIGKTRTDNASVKKAPSELQSGIQSEQALTNVRDGYRKPKG